MKNNRRTVFITGATDGIGEETALKLGKQNFKVLIHGRNEDKAKKVIQKIKNKTSNKFIDYYISDFESLLEVEKMIKRMRNELNKIDVLINNAGVFKSKREITEDGFEKTFQINYLAHFYFTNMLIDKILKSNKPQIINVASVSHKSNLDFSNLQGEKNYSGHDSYGRSKLCNILFTLKLHREIKQPGFITNCLDPGNINTKLLKKGWGAIGTDISSGAKNVIDVVNVKNKSGKYYVRGKLSEPSRIAYDKKVQDKLWNKSIEMINNCNVEFKLKY